MGRKDMDMRYVKSCMDNEGFDYCFQSYSNFEDVKDVEFHKLRQAYLDAAKALEDYVNEQSNAEEE